MSAPVYKITSGAIVLVNNLPYQAVWAILQYLQYELNMQGLVFAVGP